MQRKFNTILTITALLISAMAVSIHSFQDKTAPGSNPSIAEKLNADCEKLRLVYWLYNNDDNGCGPSQGIPLTFFGDWTMDSFVCDGRNILPSPVAISYANFNDNFNQWTQALNPVSDHTWDWINAGKPCFRVMSTITCDDTVYGDFLVTPVDIVQPKYNGTQITISPQPIVGPELEILVCRRKAKDGSITKEFYEKSGAAIADLGAYYASKSDKIVVAETGTKPFTAANIEKFYDADELCNCLKSCDHVYSVIDDSAPCIVETCENACVYVVEVNEAEEEVTTQLLANVSGVSLWDNAGNLKSRTLVQGQFQEDPTQNQYIDTDELPAGWFKDPTCTGTQPEPPPIECPIGQRVPVDIGSGSYFIQDNSNYDGLPVNHLQNGNNYELTYYDAAGNVVGVWQQTSDPYFNDFIATISTALPGCSVIPVCANHTSPKGCNASHVANLAMFPAYDAPTYPADIQNNLSNPSGPQGGELWATGWLLQCGPCSTTPVRVEITNSNDATHIGATKDFIIHKQTPILGYAVHVEGKCEPIYTDCDGNVIPTPACCPEPWTGPEPTDCTEECCLAAGGAESGDRWCQNFKFEFPSGNGNPLTTITASVGGVSEPLPNTFTEAELIAALNVIDATAGWFIDQGQLYRTTQGSGLVIRTATCKGRVCSLSAFTPIQVFIAGDEPKCKTYKRTWGKFEEPIADTLSAILDATLENDLDKFKVDCPDPCTNGSTYINGRPPASNAWSWGPYSGPNLNAFEDALTEAGYTVHQFGEKHQICPPFGAFGEDPDALVQNGIGDGSTATIEPNIDPEFVPENRCALLTIGKNDDRRDNYLETIASKCPDLVDCIGIGGGSASYIRPDDQDTEQSYGIGEVVAGGQGIKFDTSAADISPELQSIHQAVIDCIQAGGVANMVVTDQDGNTIELNLDQIVGDGNPQYAYAGTVVDGEPASGKVRRMDVTCSVGSEPKKAMLVSGCLDQQILEAINSITKTVSEGTCEPTVTNFDSSNTATDTAVANPDTGVWTVRPSATNQNTSMHQLLEQIQGGCAIAMVFVEETDVSASSGWIVVPASALNGNATQYTIDPNIGADFGACDPAAAIAAMEAVAAGLTITNGGSFQPGPLVPAEINQIAFAIPPDGTANGRCLTLTTTAGGESVKLVEGCLDSEILACLQDQKTLMQQQVALLQQLVDQGNQQAAITVERKTEQVVWVSARSDGESDDATITEVSPGLYDVSFTNAHPDGAGWNFATGGCEGNQRDNPKITLVEGTKTANGAQVMVTVDDNGGAADIFSDNPFSLLVTAECEFVSNIYVDGEAAEDEELGDVGSGPTLPESNGKVVSDNFQDGSNNAPFNLQVRNTTNGTVAWEGFLDDVAYSTIPNLTGGNYTVTTTNNGDGTFDYLFTGTLTPFSNITIIGGLPVPAGDGSGLSLFCEAN